MFHNEGIPLVSRCYTCGGPTIDKYRIGLFHNVWQEYVQWMRDNGRPLAGSNRIQVVKILRDRLVLPHLKDAVTLLSLYDAQVLEPLGLSFNVFIPNPYTAPCGECDIPDRAIRDVYMGRVHSAAKAGNKNLSDLASVGTEIRMQGVFVATIRMNLSSTIAQAELLATIYDKHIQHGEGA